MMMEDRLDCGHTEREHEEQMELKQLVRHVQETEQGRVALIVGESGRVTFVSSIPPGEAADLIEEMAKRVRRYGGNYVTDHIDRSRAARWN